MKHKHRDEILISIAGPLSNLVIALLFFMLARVLFVFGFFNSTGLGLGVVNLMVVWGMINISLFIFNLLPLPPLDGSHLYLTFLKETNPRLMMNLYKYGTLALLVLIIAENSLNVNILHLSEMINAISSYFIGLMGFGH
ncbi:MAG TPA: site-2 protease family protein [Paludibacter sp.]